MTLPGRVGVFSRVGEGGTGEMTTWLRERPKSVGRGTSEGDCFGLDFGERPVATLNRSLNVGEEDFARVGRGGVECSVVMLRRSVGEGLECAGGKKYMFLVRSLRR